MGLVVGKGGSQEITIRDAAIPNVEKFRYLGSIIGKIGDIDEDINQHIVWLLDQLCYVIKSAG